MWRTGLGLNKRNAFPSMIMSRPLLQQRRLVLSKPGTPLIATRNYRQKLNLQRSVVLRDRYQNRGSASVIALRGFHHCRIRKSRYPLGDQPPFRVFRISPLVLFFAGVGTLTLFFLLLPFLLTFFLPLFLVGVSMFQFRKWKNNTLFEQLLNGLKRSQMRLGSQTLNAMYVKSISRFFDAAANPNAGVFEELFKGVDTKMKKDGIWPSGTSLSEADRLVSFVQSRVMEAIKNDEQGIRTFFLGQDVSNWIKEGYDFDLTSENCRTLVRGFKNEVIFMVIYPLYLKSLNRPRKHLADVSVAVLQGPIGDKKSYDFFVTQTRMIRENVQCRMAIAVSSVNGILPKQFVITNEGKAGEFWSKYDVRESSDGHTEYTIRDKE
ncbi:YDL027C [Zygosaccharomyces parabailii]|nr:YDL027C [Zygosaccharomyces parabailii]CDH12620.1 uncharacterized protein ZBAI_04406 [Zygosaccharomyces bailii ISA1307]